MAEADTAEAEIARIKNAPNLYAVLNLSKDGVTDETVKKAYRKLALKL
jgi:curved DNA-binding protein CbpA